MALSRATYFASGSNRPAEIRGFSEVGHPIGVVVRGWDKKTGSATWLSKPAIAELLALGGSGLPIFIDSGAFSEVDRKLNVVAPISEEEWERIFDVFEQMARAHGEHAFPVAPDRVGDQAATIRLWKKYAPRVKRLQRLGARVIVPLQRGRKSLKTMFEAATGVFGSNFVVGLPMMKGAYEPDEVIDFVAEAKPTAVHLLGMGREAPAAGMLAAGIAEVSPKTELLMDSVLFRRVTGGGVSYTDIRRRISKQFDDQLEAIARGEGLPFAFVPLPAYEHAVTHPSEWMTKKARQTFASRARLGAKQKRSWLADPDGWLASGKRQHRYGRLVDELWFAQARRYLAPETTRRALHELFGESGLPQSSTALCLDEHQSPSCGRCRASFSGCCAFHGGLAHSAGKVRKEGRCVVANPPQHIAIDEHGRTWFAGGE